MNKTLAFVTTLALSLNLMMTSAQASDDSTLLSLQTRWAEVNYQLREKQQEAGFVELEQQAKAWIQAAPESAAAHIWLGIIKSTHAGAAGGLSALGLAKEARKALETALQLDATALDGSAYASLGTLYYKVPGWPFGFGDDGKARQLLEKALAINPDGIDPNYFYADYWYEQGDYQQAAKYANKALQAAPRPQRPLADAERRKEIAALLQKIERKK